MLQFGISKIIFFNNKCQYNFNKNGVIMPTISMFYGIKIMMYFNEHNPPHFHAKYNEFKVLIGIKDLSVID